MIERSLILYLQSLPALVSALGARNKICLIQAPSTIQMPWLVIENSGGTRVKITPNKVEEVSNVRITLDCGPAQWSTARTTIELAKNAIENARGAIEGSNDLHITCSAISGWAGINGAYRYQFTARVRFLEAYSEPVLQ